MVRLRVSVSANRVSANRDWTQIFHRICQWKKCENRSILGKDIDKSLLPTFWATLYMLSALCHRPSVRPSVCHTGESVENG